jgi:putative transposase
VKVPRALRYFVDRAYYHVYARIARREKVFAREGEASRFVEVVREVKKRDGLTILAWCVMANHYHLAVRTGTVPLWRSIRLVQWRYAREHNRRRRQLGPLWQGRYQVRLVEDQRYLLQLIAYIHLNPLSAGLVEDPKDYAWSGHRELLGRSARPLADVDAALAMFGDQRSSARRVYGRTVRSEREQNWVGERPGRLPWWGGISGESREGETLDTSRLVANPRLAQRFEVRDIDAFVAEAAAILGVEAKGLGGRGKLAEVVRAREVIAIVGAERFGMKLKDLAERLGKSPGSVSRWLGRAAARRDEDEGFADRCAELEAKLNKSATSRKRRW